MGTLREGGRQRARSLLLSQALTTKRGFCPGAVFGAPALVFLMAAPLALALATADSPGAALSMLAAHLAGLVEGGLDVRCVWGREATRGGGAADD